MTPTSPADAAAQLSDLSTYVGGLVVPAPAPPSPLRYVAFKPVGSPTSFINTPLPDGVLLSADETGPAAAALAAQASKSYINIAPNWASNAYVVGQHTPLVSPTMSPASSDGTKQQLAALVADGVPIPEDVVVGTDTDAELVIYAPDGVFDADGNLRFVDTLWELWRAKKDPTTGAWTYADGGRMSYVSSSPGHWRSRTSGATYPDVPPVGSKYRDTFERNIWGVTAAKLPLVELSITGEDLQRGVIRHALGLSVLAQYVATGKRWPAQGYDGYVAGAPLQDGMRGRLPAGFVVPTTLHPVAQMIATALRDYGFVIWDRAGSMNFRATADVKPFIDVGLSNVLDGFPWDQVQILATGSDSVPNPVG